VPSGRRALHRLDTFVSVRAAKMMQERGITPELEIFNNSQIDDAKLLIEKELLRPPFSFSFVMGMNRVNQSAASWRPQTLMDYVSQLPPRSLFSTLGIGPTQHHATVQSLLLGGGVRVGFEDNIYYRRGELAKSNAQLVERIVTVIRDLGFEPASPRRRGRCSVCRSSVRQSISKAA